MEWVIRRAFVSDTAEEAPAALMIDEQAFGAFHRRTVDPLRGYVTRVLGNATEADDIVQEAYLRLLRMPPGAPNHDEPQALRAYLFRIATNLIVDHWRRRRHERGDIDLQAAFPAGPAPNLPLRIDMVRTFEKLRPDERAMMWLAYVEGSSHREIAAALGRRERGIRVALHRTRRKLAHLLKGGQTP